MKKDICVISWLVFSSFASCFALADYEYEPAEEAIRDLALSEAKGILTSTLLGNDPPLLCMYGVGQRSSEVLIAKSLVYTPEYLELQLFDRFKGNKGPLLRVPYRDQPKPKLRYNSSAIDPTESFQLTLVSIPKGKRPADVYCTVRRASPFFGDGARKVADALYRLLLDYESANGPAAEAAFLEEVKRYQATSPKPEIVGDARKYKVQAEFALREKRFLDAADLYAEALKLAPWWPEGRFNRALVLAELKFYSEAIREMKRYLLLVPNAPDARAVEDKMFEWDALVPKT